MSHIRSFMDVGLELGILSNDDNDTTPVHCHVSGQRRVRRGRTRESIGSSGHINASKGTSLSLYAPGKETVWLDDADGPTNSQPVTAVGRAMISCQTRSSRASCVGGVTETSS